jgi:hypothetical protein
MPPEPHGAAAPHLPERHRQDALVLKIIALPKLALDTLHVATVGHRSKKLRARKRSVMTGTRYFYRTTRSDYPIGPAVIPAGTRVMLAWERLTATRANTMTPMSFVLTGIRQDTWPSALVSTSALVPNWPECRPRRSCVRSSTTSTG